MSKDDSPERMEQLRAAGRRWYKKHKEKKDKWYKENRQAHPEKYKAHNKVAWAIEAGWLMPEPCELCSETNTIAHHEDYSKPLDVNWYCKSCHAEVHHAKSTAIKNKLSSV